jgi:hypothetical protein
MKKTITGFNQALFWNVKPDSKELNSFALGHGTALALQLDHRISIDKFN